jgi:2,3-bisphosphoglycerate-independent phosphoglycerate mutase
MWIAILSDDTMKYAVILGDGMADYPVKELGGRTPLMCAGKPGMDFIAGNAAHYGLCQTTVEGLPAGSDVANLSVMGYDPTIYYTGRGPLEAGSMGIPLKPGDIAFRCNLITTEDGRIKDYSADHISTEEARQLMQFLDRHLGSDKVHFYPGISYRHLLVMEGYCPDTVCTAPHDVVGSPVLDYLPRGNGCEQIIKLIAESQEILESHPINVKRRAAGKGMANSIWPWGQGKTPSMPSFKEKFGLDGAVISAVDLIKGLGVFTGLEVINVPGTTGYLDTDYSAKASYALKVLEEKDYVFIHVEAPDEAGHEGLRDEKIHAIEEIDHKIVTPMLEGMKQFGDYRMMILPDHPTPLCMKTHARDPVPYAIYDSRHAKKSDRKYDERSMEDGLFIKPGHRLMSLFINDKL